MSKRPAFKLSLDEDSIASAQQPSYVINSVDSGLVLRSFIFQNKGDVRTADGQSLAGAISWDDVDWGDGAATKQLVGSGASGKVYHARLKSGVPVAVKCIPISSKSHRDEVARELKFLTSKYNTEFVVANYGAFWLAEEQMIAIVMEWMSYSLNDLIKFNGDGGTAEDALAAQSHSVGLPLECARDIMYQLLRALAYLHEEKKVIHRDIKPGNILISPKGEVKIADFGVSAIVETLNFSNTYVGTMVYMAPERLDEGAEYTFSSDVWSLGLTFIAAVTGGNPWGAHGQELNVFQLLQLLSSGQAPTIDADKYSSEAKSFVDLCLKAEPSERPSCTELLKHPFFSECSVESTRESTLMLITQTARLVQQAALRSTE